MWDDPVFVGPLLTLLIVSGTILLLPLSRKAAELVELLIEERRGGHNRKQIADIAATLDRIETQLVTLEERQSFAEALVARPQQPIGIAPATDPNRPRVALSRE